MLISYWMDSELTMTLISIDYLVGNELLTFVFFLIIELSDSMGLVV